MRLASNARASPIWYANLYITVLGGSRSLYWQSALLNPGRGLAGLFFSSAFIGRNPWLTL